MNKLFGFITKELIIYYLQNKLDTGINNINDFASKYGGIFSKAYKNSSFLSDYLPKLFNNRLEDLNNEEIKKFVLITKEILEN